MKLSLISSILFLLFNTAANLSVSAAPVDGVKVFNGKLATGVPCKVTYGPLVQIDNNTLRVNGLLFELGSSRIELTGARLVSSELNLQTRLLIGQGVLNRKVVITSEVLGVGYETGVLVDFQVKIDSKANPLEYSLSTQTYRNEFVFGSWVEGERGKLDSSLCKN